MAASYTKILRALLTCLTDKIFVFVFPIKYQFCALFLRTLHCAIPPGNVIPVVNVYIIFLLSKKTVESHSTKIIGHGCIGEIVKKTPSPFFFTSLFSLQPLAEFSSEFSLFPPPAHNTKNFLLHFSSFLQSKCKKKQLKREKTVLPVSFIVRM